MPRKKTESTDVEELNTQETQNIELQEGELINATKQVVKTDTVEEKPVRRKRSYVRRKTTGTASAGTAAPAEKRTRRSRKKSNEASGELFPESALSELSSAEEKNKPSNGVRTLKTIAESNTEIFADNTPQQEENTAPAEAKPNNIEVIPDEGLSSQVFNETLPEKPISENKETEANNSNNTESEAEEAPVTETEHETEKETVSAGESDTENGDVSLLPDVQRNEKGQIRHQHPKLGFNQLAGQTLAELRKIAKEIGVTSITMRRKDDLINDILKTQAEALGYRFNGGTLECMSEGYGFLRPSGLLPSSNDIYVSASQIRRFGLRNGDVVWGIIRPPKDQEHYEALLRVENVNFTDPEAARHRPHFETLTPIFPTEKLKLETDRKQIATRIVDIFAPIGKGQRALIVSPPKAGKTTLLKSLAHSITTNHPEVILMVLLIDERPEEVTDMARSVDGEIIASTFDRPAEEHLRVAALALEKAKRLVEVSKDVVLLLDSITRLARASNLIVPPSGRTLSGGMDPAALYFPKKFFGAARNIENGGSLTIIGTSLVETGSRMDDVIYEEFKGTGNMEVHLSRKIAEQRIFPALDITKSGTRKEELMVPEADLQRIWSLRRKIANMDEAEVLNLILTKLKNTPTNRDFLATIKVG